MKNSFLSRYLQDECLEVWQELYSLGTEVHRADVYSDAWAVAIETMRRVRHNIEILIPRLEMLGYQFGYEWIKNEWPNIDNEWLATQPVLLAAPSADAIEEIQNFETLVGPSPLSIRAFYSEIGEVNFFGKHPLWEQIFKRERPLGSPPSNLDPLSVKKLDEDIFEHYISWREAMQEQVEETRSYPLMIAVDYELKYNISGSGAYEIEVPNASVDAMLLHEWHQTTFVNYLRICLHYGGLPGLQYISNFLPEELAYIREGLLPV